MLEEKVEERDIGKVIGKVKVEADDMTGEYYRDASNLFKKGTKYFEIKGIPTSTAIAVEHDGHWVKAVYMGKAPFHPMNILTNKLFIALIVIGMIGAGVYYMKKENEESKGFLICSFSF